MAHYERKPMKTYTIQSKFRYWLFAMILPLILVCFGVLFVYLTVTRGGPVWFALIWLALILIGSYQQVTMPHSIELTDIGFIRFVGAFRTSTIAPQDIISVSAVAGNFIVLKHTSGKIRFLQHFTGFHDFLTELKRVNGSVNIQGC